MTDSGPQTVIRNGFFPIVTGASVSLEHAGSAAVVAGGDAVLTNAGAQLVLAGGNTSISNGGAQSLLSFGDVDINQGGTLVAAARRVKMRGGFVGVALAPRVELEDSKVLIGPLGALVLGTTLAVGAALATRRRRAA